MIFCPFLYYKTIGETNNCLEATKKKHNQLLNNVSTRNVYRRNTYERGHIRLDLAAYSPTDRENRKRKGGVFLIRNHDKIKTRTRLR